MNKLFVTNYTVSTDKNKKILLLSDIHYYDQGMEKLLNSIYEKAVKLNPNYICIPGDIIDERYVYDKEVFVDFLKKMSLISPVIISIGNHEIKTKKDSLDYYDKPLFDKLRSLNNIYILENESVEIDDFSFTGLFFESIAYRENKLAKKEAIKTIEQHFQDGIKSNKFKIVLSHSPFILINAKRTKLYKDASLILSGHTHAGISPLIMPRLTGRVLVSPAKRIFPRNSYGYLKEHKTIVSSGITRLSHYNIFHKFNFLFKGEMVIIKF